MVGLSVVLEARNCNNLASKRSPQVISKATLMINKPSFSSPLAAFGLPDFLQHCSLCRQKLSPGKDIYMYKGDRAFCSVECRCRQIFMDEEEILTKDNCSLAAIKPAAVSSAAAASSSRSSGRRKSTRNRAGGFAY